MLGALCVSAALGRPFPFAELGLMSFSFFALWALQFPENRTAANAITFARIVGFYVVLATCWGRVEWIAAGALIVLALDGLDGWVARRFEQTSIVGARLDMEADAWTVAGLCLALYASDRVGPWALAPGALRYIYVMVRMLTHAEPTERRSLLGRFAFLGIFVSLVLACVVPVPWSPVLVLLATGIAVATFLPDFASLSRPVRPHAA